MASDNLYAPFSSKREWEIAKWAKLQGTTSTAFTDLIKIEGVADLLDLSFRSSVELNQIIDEQLPCSRPPFLLRQVLVGTEMCDVYFRDIMQCIEALLDDTKLAPHMVFVPEKQYTDETKTTRLYHDMNTGKWWWATQKAVEKNSPGATIIPVIVATDKTQLTLFRNKSAYPVYLTIGNIPKEIRRKPSSHAYVLLGYLPTTRLEGVTNKASRRRMIANLYHSSMKEILKPLKEAGEEGVMMTTPDGKMRRMHPILAAFVGDYPEQVLTTCIYSGDCPCCNISRNQLGRENNNNELRDIDETLNVLSAFEDDPGHFFQKCRESRIKPVGTPFWRELPYVNIYNSITPDVLHQLYQGLIKHLVNWLIEAFGPLEIDARCRRLPANHNIQAFMKGISSLSHISGKEHDQISRILIGLVVGLDLGNGQSASRLVRSVRAMLDFLFLAQYPIHTDRTIELLDNALQDFHNNKAIFMDLGIRSSFNLPKLHFAKHYALKIKFFGTTDNFDTQYTERLHIDLAKDAYRATNRKDEFRQMTVWLERQEKIQRHDQYIGSQLNLPFQFTSPQKEWVPPGLSITNVLHLSQRPSLRNVSINDLVTKYGAFYFHEALSRFVILAHRPSLTSTELERAIWGVHMPVRRLWVWHRIKFRSTDPFNLHTTTVDSVHANPSSQRFDTVLVQIDKNIHGIHGYRAARLRTVFSMPPTISRAVFPVELNVPIHLAYVEWYTSIPQNADADHGLYKISLQQDPQDRSGHGIGSIIPVSDIVCSIHVYPQFGPFAPNEWTNKNVLDQCSTFYINPFTNRQLYRLLG
ncbi:hypothetical protein AGABI1DRAFT_35141 [Agaricus bisporus var. burnettii JB137-S8]|uniref:DUF6830 domain-containing protein n=1 Tax=Agaricus bisporus var. burnettii (strain JB137-S8 / ATCC MYA-4627 / FGSC 10392) TaxID=597362 RepID=K5XIJ5_AGABU|nr:uncharacterized protein AGABI1DRAFT_35141 [Agaricus bisporus var. burnettii JB137-S8]EKM83117.1 hypothetical protein AGABI1DRAFT_35141 [Agaricus bisporus var. burnettii JB137-S8]